MFDSAKLMYSTGGGAGFYDHPIEQSLRFNDDDSAYLSWTPASAGNRKTNTLSLWIKRSELSAANQFFRSWDLSASYANSFYFDSNDTFQWTLGGASASAGQLITSQVFRDTSSWYHIVVSLDTTQATSSDRVKIYVNGERVTAFSTETYPAQNAEGFAGGAYLHQVSAGTFPFDGYLAEVHFIDGTALDASSFGETKSGVWIPKRYSGSYGTNGFYLPFEAGTAIESGNFNAVTYTGNGSTQSITGVGFEPDLVWFKSRTGTTSHHIADSIRGTYTLIPNATAQEYDRSGDGFTSLDSDGFTLNGGGGGGGFNVSGQNFVAWCWDAGSGSPVSNTDGSITSTVKADTTNGFSVVSYTGNGSSSATVGHGLGSVPDMVICKRRDSATQWFVKHTDLSSNNSLCLNLTNAEFSPGDGSIADLSSSSTFGFYQGSNVNNVNASGGTYIAYCFSSVTGVSKFGSYTGNGSSSGPTVNLGFRPAFIMVKNASLAGSDWQIRDNARDTDDVADKRLRANLDNAEDTVTGCNFTDTGFEVTSQFGDWNGNGNTIIYMAFADHSVSLPLESDFSGNNNDFTANNLEATDVVLDSPTNNFATWNPLHSASGEFTFSEGNTKSIGASADKCSRSTMSMTTGKWYWEMLVSGATQTTQHIGIQWEGSPTGGYNGDNRIIWRGDGAVYGHTAGSSPISSYTTGDVLGFAYDADTLSLQFYKNGSTTGGAFTAPSVSGFVAHHLAGATTGQGFYANFGQDSSFAGNKTAQGNTDGNGYGDFYYAPPSGYLALCTANLPDPVASIDPAQDGSPQDHFNTVLYTGNGVARSTGNAITGVGFQPDLLWIKGRSVASGLAVQDSVRGKDGSNSYNALFTHVTNAEASQTDGDGVESLDADGFTVGYADNSNWNQSSQTYVAWNWKANGSGVSNTDGSITSTVSANTDAGFSVVKWTSDGNVGVRTIGHGLGATPKCIITKNLDNTSNWVSWNIGLPNNDHEIYLNSTSASVDPGFSVWSQSTTTFGLRQNRLAANGEECIAYVWAEVEGFSKFGSYTGNGSADGPFIYTGFRPAFVMIKIAAGDTAQWVMYDTARDTYNAMDLELQAESSNAENQLGSNPIDCVSNGFKIRSSTLRINGSGYTMIYMAFASMPTKFCASMAR